MLTPLPLASESPAATARARSAGSAEPAGPAAPRVSPGGPRRWTCSPYSVAAADRLARDLGVSRALATILTRRGYGDLEEARAFLAAEERHDPLLMPGAQAACELILKHLERGSRIVVHGDYDVDGACSTAVFLSTLRRLGAAPAWHLPSRFDEGYGLVPATVERLARERTDLLITADCGITAVDEVALARERGIEVVVTDHHRPGERLPPCEVVHPALGYPFPDLCAAAVAYKLSEVLLASAGVDPGAAAGDLDLVGLATICDLVPLRGENRRLAREGLAALARTRRPGIRALMGVAKLEPGAVDEDAVAFRLGPRLNAAGRLYRADAALELLTCDDHERAAEVAAELDALNHERREAETRVLFAAEAACAEQSSAAALVIAGEGWNPGVIGIVASRLVERHHRPCVLIALDGESGRGSGRSIPAYDLHAGLSACSSHLRRFGGHPAAAGLEIERERAHEFRRALAAHAASRLTPHDLAVTEHVDAVVPVGSLGLDLAEELQRLRPYGMSNPRPALLVPAARVEAVTGMGEERQHARFLLASGGRRARGVAFRTSQRSLAAAREEPHEAAVRLERNEWNGMTEPRVVLRALCPTRGGEVEVLGEDEPFWTQVERELAADPSAWCPPPGAPCRELRDRRGEGLAGVAGDLLSSGESVLLVCADVTRRRQGIERLIGGLGPSPRMETGTPRPDGIEDPGRGAAGPAAIVSWSALAGDFSLAGASHHVVALDPPPTAEGEGLLAALPCRGGVGFAHLAWGVPEAEFALAIARTELDLRPALAEAFRGVRAAQIVRGRELMSLLVGSAAHPSSPAVAGRLIRILVELRLVSYEATAGSVPVCRALEATERTELERSHAFREYGKRLGATYSYLASCCSREAPARRIAAGEGALTLVAS